MIVTANENYINVIMNLSAEDPFACRIISQYNSYDSSLAFVDYWTIIDDETDVQVQFPDAEQTSFYFSQIKQILKKFRHLCVLRVRQVQYAAEILTLIYTAVNLCQVLF